MYDEESTKHLNSWLVNPWVILSWLLFFIITVMYEEILLSVFFLTLFCVTLFSYSWSRYSLKNLYIDVNVSATRLFPGQEININYCIKNNKLWLLIWLQWMQELTGSLAVVPVNKSELLHVRIDEGIENFYYAKHLSWILWFQEIKWQSTWRGSRRGVYNMSHCIISSGDGFGLAAVEKKINFPKTYEIIVYPVLVPVSIDIFCSSFGITAGSRGLVEDKTLIKSTREYQAGDSFKSINWKLAALQKPLQVNIYEKINYQPVRFVLDIDSFSIAGSDEEFEDALSILASVISELSYKKVAVGLTLMYSKNPRVEQYSPKPDEEHLLEMLEALSRVTIEMSEDEDIKTLAIRLDDSAEQIYWISYRFRHNSVGGQEIEIHNKRVWKFLSYKWELGLCESIQQIDGFSVVSMKSLKQKTGDSIEL